MGNAISIGIVVPVYKVPYDMLRACFNSIHQQSYNGMKVVFVDDASPDDCGKLCDEFASIDLRISVIHQMTNQGVSAARNIGIESLDTDYITFIDADDWIDNDVIQKLVEWMNSQDTKYDVIMYRQMMNYPGSEINDTIIKERFWLSKEDRDGLQLEAISSSIKGVENRAMSIDNVAGKIISRSIIDVNKIRFKDIPYREDGVFFQEVVENSLKIAAVPIGFYHYRMREGSAVNQYRPNGPQEQLKLCELMWTFAEDNNKSDIYFNRLYSFLLIPIQMIISTYFFHPTNGKPFLTRHKECDQYLKQKPFCDMKYHVRISCLKRNSAIKYLLLRMHLYWAIYMLRDLYNKNIKE